MSGYVSRHVSVFLRVFLLVIPGRVDGELGDYFPAGSVDDQGVGAYRTLGFNDGVSLAWIRLGSVRTGSANEVRGRAPFAPDSVSLTRTVAPARSRMTHFDTSVHPAAVRKAGSLRYSTLIRSTFRCHNGANPDIRAIFGDAG